MFRRISEIVMNTLLHDHLQLVFRDQTGGEEFSIVGDLSKERPPVTDPADLQDRIVAVGFRSFLGIHTVAGVQEMTVLFSSRRANLFSRDDVPVARLVAFYIALAVSREQSSIPLP